MAVGARPPFICKWRLEAIPHFEVRIADNPTRTKRVASLVNTVTGDAICTIDTLKLTTVFDRCVWKANHLPTDAPLESWLFRGVGKSGCWVGVNADTQTLSIKDDLSFEDIQLKTHQPVFHAPGRVAFEKIKPEQKESCDLQAEKGIIRPCPDGEVETVHIWDHVGEGGMADVKLMHKRKAAGQPREILILRIFYRATGVESPIKLTNPDSVFNNKELSIDERIGIYALHPIAMLGDRRGNFYGNVTLSAIGNASTAYQNFCNGRNLQAADLNEIADYVKNTVFVVKNGEDKMVHTMKYRLRVQVSRAPQHDFGNEHGGKLDAIHIHISQNMLEQWALLPFKAITSFFSGMFNRKAPEIHQLKNLDLEGMGDLLLENDGAVTPLDKDTQKTEIFKHFDRALEAGANIDFYIAEDRQTARLRVGSSAADVRSAAASGGRFLALRWVWERPLKPADTEEKTNLPILAPRNRAPNPPPAPQPVTKTNLPTLAPRNRAPNPPPAPQPVTKTNLPTPAPRNRAPNPPPAPQPIVAPRKPPTDSLDISTSAARFLALRQMWEHPEQRANPVRPVLSRGHAAARLLSGQRGSSDKKTDE